MGHRDSTVRARELALALNRAVRAAGLSNSDLARRFGWSAAKVTHMFKAERGLVETDVAQIIGMCRIVGEERNRLLRLVKDAHEPGWWQEYDGRLPAELRTLIDHEDSAVAISNYQSELVPGLLQTRDYTEALLRSSAVIPADEIKERADAREKRQQIFSRYRPAAFHFFIDEYVLRRTGPGREVMSDQVHHLLRMSVRPCIELRVIPDSVGFHAGSVGPFILMDFNEINPVVHMENATSSLFAERAGTVQAYRAILTDLAKVALDGGQSREWIAQRAKELGASLEGDL